METAGGKAIALRGAALTVVADAFEAGIDKAMRYESDAIVAMSGGKITHFGPASQVSGALPEARRSATSAGTR